MAVSIQDVAKKAKVSPTTVSRALNDHPYVSKKTKERIFKVMEELHYYPNNIAQQLRGKRTNLIGVTISYITNPFFAYLVDAIEKKAKELGYHLIVLQTSGDSSLEKYYLELIAKRQLDGVIVTSMEEITPQIQQLIDQQKLVLCNRYIGESDIEKTVRIDEEEASYLGTKYMIEKGHKRIAYCTGSTPITDSSDRRFKGFLKALDEANIAFNSDFFFNALGVEGGQAFIDTFAKMKGDKPTAVFSNGDTVAAAMIGRAKQYGIRIPEDLAILGFDDQPIAQFTTPTLTTIAQPIKEMGELATEILIAGLEGREIPAYQTLDAPLIIRDSI